jgi:ABC-type multidrug transport system ATPase subunit
VKHLSGGSKRKLCLACACLGDPQLLILDEPSFGMDPVSRRQIWTFLQELKGQGKTIIFTTQDLEEAEAVADRTGILVHG